MKKTYYNSVIEIISDLTTVFNVIPTGETRTVKCWKDTEGNLRSFSFDTNVNITRDPLEATEALESVIVPLLRRAETNEDFQFLFEKALRESGSTDKDIFRKRQIEVFQARRDELKQFNDQGYDHFIDLLDRYIKFLQSNDIEKQVTVKKFAEYLKHPEPEEFAEKIKKEFPSIIKSGRDSAALYLALEKSEQVKYIESNIAIFNSMTEYFGCIGNIKGFNIFLNHNHPNYNNLKESGIVEKFVNTLRSIE